MMLAPSQWGAGQRLRHLARTFAVILAQACSIRVNRHHN